MAGAEGCEEGDGGEGGRTFGDFTGNNIGRQLAIVLDDTVYSAPVIRSKIGEGRGQIEGSFTAESARDLAIVLRAGALPAPVQIIANLTQAAFIEFSAVLAGIKEIKQVMAAAERQALRAEHAGPIPRQLRVAEVQSPGARQGFGTQERQLVAGGRTRSSQ